ncbi:MAG: hypothetical protein QOC72_2215 [Methylobacteriaceae bacterium]|nr:hypothetical protein [Methylobacteriaceae bacterium]
MSDFSNFRAIYDELTDEVSSARYQFIPDHLQRWFEHIEDAPSIAEIVHKLQEGLNFEEWYEAAKATYDVDGASFNWPKEREKNLGMKLLLFRACADGELDAADIGYWFVAQHADLNMLARAFVTDVFVPMARELRRYLEQVVQTAPASDRVVQLNHNQPEYKEVGAALEALERTLAEANDYPGEPEEREQRIAEVSATRRLLAAARVRTEALVALVRPLAIQFGTKLKDTVIGTAVTALMAALGALIGRVLGAF